MSKNKKSNTVWKKRAIEGLTSIYGTPPDGLPTPPSENKVPDGLPTPPSENKVPDKTPTVPPNNPSGIIPPDQNQIDYGHDTKIDKSQAEDYITNNKLPKNGTNIPGKTLDPKTVDKWNEFYDIFKNLDATKLKQLYTSAINSIKDGLNNIPDSMAKTFISGFYDNFKSPEAKHDLSMLASQLSGWMKLVATYVIVLNWWYVLCYTNYTFDFRSVKVPFMHWITAPVFNALEILNYPIFNFRMDAKVSAPYREMMLTMWDWRPIIFTVFHIVVMTILVTSPVTDGIASNMMNTGILFGIMSALALIYFGSLFIQEKWSDKFMNGGFSGYLILVALTIGAIIGLFVFILIACPVFMIYIAFFSNWVILVFNYFWPPSIYSVVKQIFQELKESPIPHKWESNLLKTLFNNAHSIYLISIVIAMLGVNINQALSFYSNPLMVITIIINALFGIMFSSGFISIIKDLFGALPTSNEPIQPDE